MAFRYITCALGEWFVAVSCTMRTLGDSEVSADEDVHAFGDQLACPVHVRLYCRRPALQAATLLGLSPV
jgi:hypothetical protein